MTLTVGQVLMAALAWALCLSTAALMLGLWWGEKGRRAATERLMRTGRPDEVEESAVSMAPAPEAEDRFRQAAHEVSEKTIERAVQDLYTLAKARGEPISKKELERDVRQMFAGQDVM